MVIPILLVFLGFFVVFYSSVIDFLTTYLPEELVKYAIPVGLLGWGIQSLGAGSPEAFVTSLKMTLVSFTIGAVLYYTKHWASGDMWLMGAASALLSPALDRFWPMFFVYSAFWAGVLGTIYYFYFFFKYGIYRKYRGLLLVFVGTILVFLSNPAVNLPLLGVAFILLIVFTRRDVEALFIFEKPVKELEEDDWILEDIKLGKETIKASRPVGKREAELARKYGKGKVKVRGGVPMTPAFSLAAISLLV